MARGFALEQMINSQQKCTTNSLVCLRLDFLR